MSHARSISLAALFGSALAISWTVQAADPAVAAAKPTAAASAGDGKQKLRDPNEVVCRNMEVLGSRLAKRRVCMTRSEWAEANRNERGALERAQVQRGLSSSQ